MNAEDKKVLSFNSMIVRLKGKNKLKNHPFLLRFNSMIVRLKVEMKLFSLSLKKRGFNSMIVRLKGRTFPSLHTLFDVVSIL